jgi:alkylation response protein AidB-like acyl-CoA dehydrogenase
MQFLTSTSMAKLASLPMRLAEGATEARVRAELGAWLDAHAPPEEMRRQEKRSSADLPQWARDWQRTLFEAGWLIPGWPEGLGGRDATPAEQMIYFEEMSRRELPRSLNPQGIGIVAPSIRDYGTPEQQERWLIPTLRAEIGWCIGMSEPGAGSDLAGLRTRAELHGDTFVINGQKVWTSGAHDADWCVCYVRTDPEAPKHRGISALIVEMSSPGVDARPFPELSGPQHCDFNEVFFTDVEVPAGHLLGELNGGWAITRGSLAHERAMLWIDYAYSAQRAVNGLRELADEPTATGRIGDDGRFRDEVASLYIDAQAMLCMGYSGFAKHLKGEAAPEHSVLKLFGSETIQRAMRVGTDALGVGALDDDKFGPAMWRAGSWPMQWLRSFAGTIPGGTSEIQRNIIAERVLGLPR